MGFLFQPVGDSLIDHPDDCFCILCLPTAKGPERDEGENADDEVDHLQPDPDLQASQGA